MLRRGVSRRGGEVPHPAMEEARPDNQEVRLQIRQLGTPRHVVGGHNVVVLADEYQRELYIAIGPCEAMAILRRLEALGEVRGAANLVGSASSQPYAHDLLMAVCESLGAELEKVVIDDLWNNTYYAKLHFLLDGEDISIDARPSDGIALALRAEAPIYAAEAVMVAATRSQEEEE